MKVTPVQTDRIEVGGMSLLEFLDANLATLPARSVVVVASKIVSLCEGRLEPATTSKERLIARESERHLPPSGPYRYRFTITHRTLIPAAGIDESNVGGGYLLWPADPQGSANAMRRHLAERHRTDGVGVLITDSTCIPLRRGTVGMALAHSGFRALNSYVGQRDLFGRVLQASQANLAAGLAAAAVATMGEGAERTPLCVIEDLPLVHFQERDPTEAELDELLIDPEDDVFGAFLGAVPWLPGGNPPAARGSGADTGRDGC